MTWKHTGTSDPPADLKDKTPKEVFDMAHLGSLGQRQRLQKTLPLSHKEKNKDVAIEMDNQEKAIPKNVGMRHDHQRKKQSHPHNLMPSAPKQLN